VRRGAALLQFVDAHSGLRIPARRARSAKSACRLAAERRCSSAPPGRSGRPPWVATARGQESESPRRTRTPRRERTRTSAATGFPACWTLFRARCGCGLHLQPTETMLCLENRQFEPDGLDLWASRQTPVTSGTVESWRPVTLFTLTQQTRAGPIQRMYACD